MVGRSLPHDPGSGSHVAASFAESEPTKIAMSHDGYSISILFDEKMRKKYDVDDDGVNALRNHYMLIGDGRLIHPTIKTRFGIHAITYHWLSP